MFDGVGGVGGPQGAVPVSKDNNMKHARSVGDSIGLRYMEEKYGESYVNMDLVSNKTKKGPGGSYEVALEFYTKKGGTSRAIDYDLLQKTVDKFNSGPTLWKVAISPKSISTEAVLTVLPALEVPGKNK